MKSKFKYYLLILILLLCIACSFYIIRFVTINNFYIDENSTLSQIMNIPLKKLVYNVLTILIPLLSASFAIYQINYYIEKLSGINLKKYSFTVFKQHLTFSTFAFILVLFDNNQFNLLIAVISLYTLLKTEITKEIKTKSHDKVNQK